MQIVNSFKTPVVSIFCLVYNHELYIKDCLEGFLMQKCNFDYEIVIGEDCSTDNSRLIILEYAQRFPTKFKLLFHDKNIGGSENQMFVFENCTGKYIAMCEGDDYWTDPNKLQKQVDFLEMNEDFVCVGGKVRIKDTRNESNKLQYGQQYFEYSGSQEVPKEDVLDKVKLPFQTSTYLFKRNALDLKLFELLFKHSISGDIPILNILNSKGKLFYINEELGVKNHISTGITAAHEHKGINFLWNRVYMWVQISKLYKQYYLRNIAIDNSKYFERFFTKKFLNVKLAEQITFYRNTRILHQDLARVILIAFIQKVFLKLRLKR